MSNTLPAWFWIVYYLFLAVTIGVAIYNLSTSKNKTDVPLGHLGGHHGSYCCSLE